MRIYKENIHEVGIENSVFEVWCTSSGYIQITQDYLRAYNQHPESEHYTEFWLKFDEETHHAEVEETSGDLTAYFTSIEEAINHAREFNADYDSEVRISVFCPVSGYSVVTPLLELSGNDFDHDTLMSSYNCLTRMLNALPS